MNEAENKKEYELSYLLTPEVQEDKTEAEIEELKKIIGENGGEITQTNPLEKKQLAYPVKKQNYAYLGVLYFNIDDKDSLAKIKKVLTSNKKVLRFLILNEVIKQKIEKPLETSVEKPSFDQKLESILNS